MGCSLVELRLSPSLDLGRWQHAEHRPVLLPRPCFKMGDAKPKVLTKLPVVSTCNDALFKCFEPFTFE
jgi:hypothetical protein